MEGEERRGEEILVLPKTQAIKPQAEDIHWQNQQSHRKGSSILFIHGDLS